MWLITEASNQSALRALKTIFRLGLDFRETDVSSTSFILVSEFNMRNIFPDESSFNFGYCKVNIKHGNSNDEKMCLKKNRLLTLKLFGGKVLHLRRER